MAILGGAGGMMGVAHAAWAQCPSSFTAGTSYATGTHPTCVVAADFNHDGKLDLATANSGTGTLTVWLGSGAGTFTNSGSYAAGSSPRFITARDLNGDGHGDLVVANYDGANISVLLGIGNGNFGPAANYASGASPSAVAIGDFNGDGRPDMAVTNDASDTVSVLIGQGFGVFGAPVAYGVGRGSGGLVTADFNGDGRLDLAKGNYTDGTMSVLIGNGNGTFAAAATYAAGTRPSWIASEDFNGDGRPDVAVTNLDSNNISVFLGQPNGTFGAAVNYGTGPHPISVTTGDFNGDGRVDLVVSNQTVDTVSVLLGSGSGTFSTPATYPSGSYPLLSATGDFNGDGKTDVATPNWTSNTMSLLLNTTSGAALPVFMTQPTSQLVQAGGSVTLTAAANFFGGPTAYQWRRDGVTLSNGGNISGASTATLTINPVSASDQATYDVQATSDTCAGVQTAALSSGAVLAVTAPAAIFNDSCSSPRPVYNGVLMTFSTAGATTDGPTEANLGFCCGDLQVNQDVWFLYTAPSSGIARVNLCNSNYDSKVAIYHGTACPGGPNTAIGGNDDSCGVQSVADFTCLAGEQYLIRVGAYRVAVGNVQMIVTSPVVCPADFNSDGSIDFFDYLDFVNAFAVGC